MRATRTAMAAALFLAACGGGGGGSSPPPPPAPFSLSFTPATLTASLTEGTSVAMSVNAAIDRAPTDPISIGIIDTRGVIRPEVNLEALSQTVVRATLFTAPTLPAGNYAGSLEVRICRDLPTTCAQPLAGSPWRLPYNITVTTAPVPPAPPPPAPPPPPPPPPPAGATFSPAQVSISAYQEEVPPFQVTASLSGITGAVYPQFVDPAGVFQPNPPQSGSSFATTATLYVSTALAPGSYSGNIQLRLCQDLPCTSQYPNSPILLPYSVTLRPAVNLTPLSALTGAGDWAMHQGNAAHTGFVPVTLDATKFNRRWKWTLAGSSEIRDISPVVTSNGRVYAVISGRFAVSNLLALNEHDKTEAWNYNFGSIFTANPPAVGDGRVFVATSGHADTFMWSFNESSGTSASKVPFSSQWERYYAPTIHNGAVFTNGGAYGGLLSFKTSDGTQNWFTGLSQFDQWTPAVDAQYAYAYTGSATLGLPGRLFAIDRVTGGIAFEIADPDYSWNGYSVMGTPLLGGADTVITVNGRYMNPSNRLISFNTATRSIRWSVPGRFMNDPAIANGVIYIANGSQLEARRESDGALQWSWTPPESNPAPFDGGYPSSNVIVTANLAFVSTTTRTYAVDLATRSDVWSFPQAGKLALSRNGVLYIVGTGTNPSNGQSVSTLTAINLQ